MAKKLRENPILIAPEILGWIDVHGNPIVLDERNGNTVLDPTNIDHKIIIYKRQVEDWFLNPASKLIKYKNRNKGFIVLMICLSYIEGIEQFKRGQSSRRRSAEFFVSSMNRIYPGQYQEHQLNDLYHEARCGLFHNGMVEGRIIISNFYAASLQFEQDDIKINPMKFLKDIKEDFGNYITNISINGQLRTNFDNMYRNY